METLKLQQFLWQGYVVNSAKYHQEGWCFECVTFYVIELIHCACADLSSEVKGKQETGGRMKKRRTENNIMGERKKLW